jgi:hypothetical protein
MLLPPTKSYGNTCPQWVNSMTLVINQLFDQKILNDEQPNEAQNDITK